MLSPHEVGTRRRAIGDPAGDRRDTWVEEFNRPVMQRLFLVLLAEVVIVGGALALFGMGWL